MFVCVCRAGITAVVRAIYEPKQDCAADGVNMLDDPDLDKVASRMLCVVFV